jgi:protocatechuate 3,4-dioxygenase beta subunit
MTSESPRLARRVLLHALVALSAPVALAIAAGRDIAFNVQSVSAQRLLGFAQIPPLQLTPDCADADDLTPAQTEGPYFTRNSPQSTALLEAGDPGTRLVVSGLVLTTQCQPVPGALLDFWQANSWGQYDNVGYRYRGHQFTEADGRFYLETVMPGLYPGRTRHIHVKAQAPGSRVLTTQLYFPGEPGNARDGIYRRDLEMHVADDQAGGKTARFDFVIATA